MKLALLSFFIMFNFLSPLVQSKDSSRKEPIKVACVGDSITFGSGASDRNITAYPAVLQFLLGSEKFDVLNFGLGSATVLQQSKTDLFILVTVFCWLKLILLLHTR